MIKGDQFVGAFKTDEEAYRAGIRKYGNTAFLIKQVVKNYDDTVHFEIHIPSNLAIFLSKRRNTIPRPISGLALIDTGATSSCVDKGGISNLGVQPVGIVNTSTAGGKVKQNVYPAKLYFPVEKIWVEFSRATGVDIGDQTVDGKRIIALIGRDPLSRWVLIYNGPGGLFTLGIQPLFVKFYTFTRLQHQL
ncbi:MAG: hypothetical protein A2043_01890 [Candidatus Schekmanbacteria bacterium GWA2_38_9]|nr:MAG: hypothetical protein A2043_01890 [Candidatus Schekmanbacteria bacterium GWA2_38_9]OHB20264.1 MAG: hypothetical protein A2666_03345 [Parcubacteria group bacterium RIFCSPHIGHO2_01_FULL_47_10b]